MSPLLLKMQGRHLLQHPWQLVLAIIGVAMGVAVVVAIDLTKVSAQQAFDDSMQGVLGKTTHRLIGGTGGLTDALYVQLKLRHDGIPMAPVVEGRVSVTGKDDRTLQVLGIDPLAEVYLRSYWQPRAEPLQNMDWRKFFTARSAVLTRSTASRLGIESGATLAVRTGTTEHLLQVIGILDPDNERDRVAMDDKLITDIATAQEMLDMTGYLSRIDLILGDNDDAMAKLKSLLPADAELVTAEGRSQATQKMTRAFHEHLHALSLLALVVGVFLIYNTMSFLVVQRRPVVGMLRTLGVTGSQIFQLTLYEALLLGCIGTVLGCITGIVLGKGLLLLVTRTINDIYYALSIHELAINRSSLMLGIILGLAGSLVAALVPAMEAAYVTPRMAMSRSLLERNFRRATLPLALAGCASLGSGWGLLTYAASSTTQAFLILATMLAGTALLTPLCTRLLAWLARPWFKLFLGLMGNYAARNVSASLSRTAVACAALMLAVATTIGIGLMIQSFRMTVNDWLDSLLRADFYVMPDQMSSNGSGPVTDAQLDALTHLPGVRGYSTARHLTLEDATGLTHLTAYRMAPESYSGFHFLAGDTATLWSAFENDAAVIVSEPYAYKYKTHVGQSIRLRTDAGPQAFTVVGIYRDYSSEAGVVALSRRTFEHYWRDRGYNSVGLYIDPGVPSEQIRSAVTGLQVGTTALTVTSSRELRLSSLVIFDRTFAITGVLRLLAGAIAFVGIFSALMAMQFERTRELGVMRAVGFTPSQLGVSILAETTLLGIIAGLMALPVGVAMAALLVFVINRRSFGWSMPLHIDGSMLLAGFALALIAAWLAGCYPAWRMARTAPAQALRNE